MAVLCSLAAGCSGTDGAPDEAVADSDEALSGSSSCQTESDRLQARVHGHQLWVKLHNEENRNENNVDVWINGSHRWESDHFDDTQGNYVALLNLSIGRDDYITVRGVFDKDDHFDPSCTAQFFARH